MNPMDIEKPIEYYREDEHKKVLFSVVGPLRGVKVQPPEPPSTKILVFSSKE